MINGISTVWLPVTDLQRSVAFYGDTLGLKVTEQDGGEWAEVEAGGLTIGLNARAEESPDGSGGAVIAFSCDGDIEGEVERLKGQGVSFTGDVSEHPWGRIAPFKDVDGNDLQVFAPPA